MLAYRCVNDHCKQYGKAFNGEPEREFCKCGDAFEVFQVPDDDEVDRLRAVNAILLSALRDIADTCEANMNHSNTVRENANRPRGPEGEAMYQRVKTSTEIARSAIAQAENDI